MVHHHHEHHLVHRTGWLRAAVLGANDGILSTASLIVGVATADASKGAVLVAGLAGMVAGAMSMAAGEYVSVSSQADAEAADLKREAHELEKNPQAERRELAGIYRERGLDADLADQVAEQMMAHDALGAHMRDELGLSEITSARPVQAAIASAASFAAGALPPVLLVMLLPHAMLALGVTVASLLLLVGLGMLGARAGGAPMLKGAARVTFWGAAAMGATALIGHLVGSGVAM